TLAAPSESRAAPATTLRLEPAAAQASLTDTTALVDVRIDDVAALASFEFAITYDPTVVTLTGVAPSAFLSSSGRTVYCVDAGNWAGTLDDVYVVTFGCNSVGLVEGGAGMPGASGSDVLATLAVVPVAGGTTALAFVGV